MWWTCFWVKWLWHCFNYHYHRYKCGIFILRYWPMFLLLLLPCCGYCCCFASTHVHKHTHTVRLVLVFGFGFVSFTTGWPIFNAIVKNTCWNRKSHCANKIHLWSTWGMCVFPSEIFWQWMRRLLESVVVYIIFLI